ncbi:MAG: hypothetical protein R8G66_31735 [Cytophagales bacterium]|nr:hypothetical protein [Cytophagales bacterium]
MKKILNSSFTPNEMKMQWTLILLIVFYYSCSSDEPNCMIDPSMSGRVLEVIGSADQSAEYYLLSEDFTERVTAPSLCDPETFATITPISFQARLDSAYVNNCEECLKVIEWTGPGCPLEPNSTSAPRTFQDMDWRFARLEFLDGFLNPPCDAPMNVRFHTDGTFSLIITSNQHGKYEFDGEALRFVEISETLGIAVGGYLGLFDGQLRQHLYERAEPLQLTLENDQLILFREAPYVRIVLIP